MSYGDQAAPGQNGQGDGLDRLWSDEDIIAAEDGVADLTAGGLANVGFIKVALRRGRLFWATLAVVGLIIGAGLYLSSPVSYQAETTLLLTVGPEPQPGIAILDNQAMAQTESVAKLALKQLGGQQSAGSILKSYTATVVTDRVLRITASAPSSEEAVRIANAVAAAFLQFRADQLRQQRQLQTAALDQEVVQAQQHVTSIASQISQLSGQSTSSSQQASNLQTQLVAAKRDLTALKQTTSGNNAVGQVTTASMITGSKVIDTAMPLAHSRYRGLLVYAMAGFIIGLVLGVGIIAVRALTSDRPYRRDDVARALGAPVKLSILDSRATRRLRKGQGGLAAAESRDIQRIVAHLRGAIRADRRSLATLAVVPVSDPQVTALAVASLAVSHAQEGRRVVLADLCGDSPGARLLGVKDPGVQMASVEGAQLVAIIPGPEEIVPVGPLKPASPHVLPPVPNQVASACSSADILLTLISLDASVGADHLATWAADAAVVIAAGRSSWTKIEAVGEMIRLAGTRLVSAVLIGSDKGDESLGVVTGTPQAGRGTAVREAAPAYAKSHVAAADQGSGGRSLNDDPRSRNQRW